MVNESAEGSIDVDMHGVVAVLTLRNPPVNAITLSMTRQMSRALDLLGQHDKVRAVVLTGAGRRAFSAGSDINEMPGLARRDSVVADKVAFENETLDRLEALPLLTIAALNGATLGGGLEWAMCCDLIVGEPHIRLGLPEVDLGLIPSSGGTRRSIERIGVTRTNQLVLTGEPISAATAINWGLINEVVEPGQSASYATALAKKLAAKSKIAVTLNKQAIEQARHHSPSSDSINLFERAFMSTDSRALVRAFLSI